MEHLYKTHGTSRCEVLDFDFDSEVRKVHSSSGSKIVTSAIEPGFKVPRSLRLKMRAGFVCIRFKHFGIGPALLLALFNFCGEIFFVHDNSL